MLPILYSFRRCPYAIRARLALHVSGVQYELREVLLRNKPAEMLAASSKGSVPVLVLPSGQIIDESWDIMRWALDRHDPENWLGKDQAYLQAAEALLTINDGSFKAALDRYKYAERHPEQTQTEYRMQGEIFLRELEDSLQRHAYLAADHFTVADAAVAPFIRQFAAVDTAWFAQAPYPRLRAWHAAFIQSDLFQAVMGKYPVWQAGATHT